ncbi:MAG: DNA helicase PcrA [Lachnospiraceae bacterium]|nr:DNA helicase PcrA [Lachnospiraceae bacterium]
MQTILNPPQQEAVEHLEGPLLILAGAGSGKTRVITHRTAYLIEQGINPYHILAITFTNKAAGEVRERVDDLIGFGSESVWISTFHSLCVRILRRHIERIGFQTNFTIYDTEDQKRMVKEVARFLQLDPKMYPERRLMAEISKAKEEFISPHEYDLQAQGDYRRMQIARVYTEYQKRLHSNNALDFDDLLYKVVQLFQDCPDVLEQYQERFRYIMVDEYQDTNEIQFLLVRQLARKYRNLCVVGDDDQSIYKFRGANIKNILNFEQEYPEAKVIKLEQNYRSTGNILNAANGVIRHNVGRKDKTLWTAQEAGDPIRYKQYENEYQEAEQIVWQIWESQVQDGRNYSDFAVLYRTNAQSRVLEEKLLMKNIPYKIYGGQNFYARLEIKDLLAYLKTIANGSDDISVKRIINVPKRGIGAATIAKVEDYAMRQEISFLDALFQAEDIPGIGKAAGKLQGFTDLISDLREELTNGLFLNELFDEILEKTDYREALIAEHTEESMARVENIEELRNKIVKYEEEAEHPSLDELLEEIALVAEVDSLNSSDDRVVLMTIHSAKGLEFPYVFLCGMEERLFPSSMAMSSEDEDAIEEERRLCYVGITRAKERLFLSSARQRMMNGSNNYNPISRFIKEIPEELLDLGGYRKAVNHSVPQAAPSNVSKVFTAKPSYGKTFTVNRAEQLEYEVGSRVRHIKFGVGIVQEIKNGGKDYEVTVDFDDYGIKRMFASFAKLKKIEDESGI